MKLYNILKNESAKVKKAITAINSFETQYSSATTHDAVIESGISGNWSYRKYISGIAECWGTFEYTITSWSAWGSVVEGTPLTQWDYPTNLFIAPPFFQATCSDNTGAVGITVQIWNKGTALKTPLVDLLRPTPAPSGSSWLVRLNLFARGRWAGGNILCRPFLSELEGFSHSSMTINYPYNSNLAKADCGYFEFTCTGASAGAWTYTFVSLAPYTGPCELIINIQSVSGGSGIATINVSITDGSNTESYSAVFPGNTTGRTVTPIDYVPTTSNAMVTVTMSPASSNFSTTTNKSFISLQRLVDW